MSNQSVFVGVIVARDPEMHEVAGMVRPAITESSEKALDETLAELLIQAPQTAAMETQISAVIELPRAFLEAAAREVLGWKEPQSV